MVRVPLVFIAVQAAFIFASLGLELDCSQPDAIRKLEREIREREYNDDLFIYLMGKDNIPELPKHDFRAISVSGYDSHCDKIISLSPLAGYKLKTLELGAGSFIGLDTLHTETIRHLRAIRGAIRADEFSRGQWTSLRELNLSKVNGKILDLRSAAGLETLYHIDDFGDDGDIAIQFSPQMRLKDLLLGVRLPLLRSIHTGSLEKLSIDSSQKVDYSPLAEADLPNLTELDCCADSETPYRLPFMPKLEKLALVDCPAVSLKHIRTQCPQLKELKLYRIHNITDWDALPLMPLKELCVYECDDARWSLPVDPPPGCEVTGLPHFTENPYKMWSTWAILTVLFGLWTFFRQKRKRRASGRTEELK